MARLVSSLHPLSREGGRGPSRLPGVAIRRPLLSGVRMSNLHCTDDLRRVRSFEILPGTVGLTSTLDSRGAFRGVGPGTRGELDRSLGVGSEPLHHDPQATSIFDRTGPRIRIVKPLPRLFNSSSNPDRALSRYFSSK